jgi:hypothetical protein
VNCLFRAYFLFLNGLLFNITYFYDFQLLSEVDFAGEMEVVLLKHQTARLLTFITPLNSSQKIDLPVVPVLFWAKIGIETSL